MKTPNFILAFGVLLKRSQKNSYYQPAQARRDF
jgi:hypothetical protein